VFMLSCNLSTLC